MTNSFFWIFLILMVFDTEIYLLFAETLEDEFFSAFTAFNVMFCYAISVFILYAFDYLIFSLEAFNKFFNKPMFITIYSYFYLYVTYIIILQ